MRLRWLLPKGSEQNDACRIAPAENVQAVAAGCKSVIDACRGWKPMGNCQARDIDPLQLTPVQLVHIREQTYGHGVH